MNAYGLCVYVIVSLPNMMHENEWKCQRIKNTCCFTSERFSCYTFIYRISIEQHFYKVQIDF